MKNKRVIYIIFSAFILFATISFASAGFGDWLKGLFEEPQLGPFNATATVQGVPPRVPRIFNVSDDFASSLLNYVQVTPNGASNVYVTFLAEDDNGRADLPAGSLTIGTDVFINLTYTGNRATTANYVASGASSDTCVEVINCGSCSGIQRMYFCNLSSALQFYYQPNVNASPVNPNLWIVGARIRDGGSLFGLNVTQNFSYLELTAAENIVNLTWVGISPSGTNQKSADNVTVINKGNKFIDIASITAYNLTGNNFGASPARRIPARAIRAYGQAGSECADPPGITFAEDLGRNVAGVALDYGPAVQNPIRFCIFPQLSSFESGILDLSDSPYIASGGRPGTADWRLQVV